MVRHNADNSKKYYEAIAKRRNQTITKITLVGDDPRVWLRCGRCGHKFDLSLIAFRRIRAIERLDPPDLEKEALYPFSCRPCFKAYRGTYIAPSPFYKGEASFEEECLDGPGRHSPEARAWREAVYRKDRGCCFLTKSRENPAAHHLYSWARYPDKRFLVSNGIIIAEHIHELFHGEYGSHTTPADFEKFCREEYGVFEFPWSTWSGVDDASLLVTTTETKSERTAKKAFALGLKIIDGAYVNQKSVITLYCPLHKNKEKVTLQNFWLASFHIKCCPGVKQPLQRDQKARVLAREQQIKDKAERLGHVILDGKFEKDKSPYKMYCPIHKEEMVVGHLKYMRASHGIDCCKYSAQRKMEERAEALGHVILRGTHESTLSLFDLLCSRHGPDAGKGIRHRSYMRAKNGLPCCRDLPPLINLPIN